MVSADKLIYVADDEENIRELIKMFLENTGFRTEIFPTGDALYERYSEVRPDLIIMDIMMPGTDGLALCERISAESSVPVVLISAKDEEMDRVMGIMRGGDDYLVKPFSPMELIARIQGIFRRMEKYKTYMLETNGNNLVFEDLFVDIDKREIFVIDEALNLSPIQYDLLYYFIENNAKAISREELIREVWKQGTDFGVRITDDMVKRVRKKLAVAGSRVTIENVWGFGFKLAGVDIDER